MAKNGICSENFFVKLIYLISRVFLAWTFLNFLTRCELVNNAFGVWLVGARLWRMMRPPNSQTLKASLSVLKRDLPIKVYNAA